MFAKFVRNAGGAQAAEHVAELLNTLTPDQLALLARRLQSGMALS